MQSQKDYGWLVEARTSIQGIQLDLFNFLSANKPQLAARPEEARIFALLHGAAFSLWRAAFLADKPRDLKAVLDDLETFLGRVIENNAIIYSDDRLTASWSSGYYINNCYYRVGSALKRLVGIDSPEHVSAEALAAYVGSVPADAELKASLLTAFLEQRHAGITDADTGMLWDKGYAALNVVFDLLQQKLSKNQ